MGTPGLQGRSAVRDEALLFYTGLFGQRPHGASALEGILRDYFEVPVEVVQFIGRWVKIGPENENRLGVSNCELGRNLICGPRVWERQSKFRVRIGPLDLEAFRMLLPCGSGSGR